ncbi:uncharacterized protein LOC120266746 [Dioscorea cayenensis subsp. rotundata]|uniref:Uncharacterized protein LOC120266746 n=1 Tax=Dioscorea cayennensis subsp. rotundata TaxID=55577 RepID=A0AB40BSD9_DIOCR|nr:uncharacterized protein LOC120266746 [Dioscorea cayenensis subsp. rotundata]
MGQMLANLNALFGRSLGAAVVTQRGNPNLADIRDANSLLNDLYLHEPPAMGRRFTWTNGQENPIWVKLDRFLVNRARVDRFPRLIQNCLPRLGSDHVPIRLEVGMHCSKPRSFRFENVWTTVDGFADLVSRWWAGPVPNELIDVIKETRALSAIETTQERDLLDSLAGIRRQEEVYWKQRSRLQWLKEGDENTRYFHTVANGRKNINFIPDINDGSSTFTDAKDIGKVFEQRFRALFGQRRPFRFKVDLDNLFKNKASVDLSFLELPFTIEEVKRAVFDLGSDKAPGPDGFPMSFFKTFWETVKGEIWQLCEDFYTGKANLERINWASIVLIPKVLCPSSPGDYRPISLINSSLKVISKILASRLSMVMDSLVDHAQSAFLKGRCILDNIAMTEEAIFSIHKRRLMGHILKVDFAKAFDSVDWDFLLELLKARGFGPKWLGWISSILGSSKATILINGSPSGYVRYQRGLRQGDPLSPMHFVLVSDVLCTMFDNALNSKILIGVPLGEQGSICNLHYADDLLVMTVGGAEDLRLIKLILLIFEGPSGLETNFSKTCLYTTNLHQLPQACEANTVNCDVGLLPVTYLGIPISGRRSRKQDWESLVTKVRGRLSSWKSSYLSMGGRLTLVNSVLSALPTYWMSLFRLPKWVIKAIDRIRRDFLWSSPDIDHPGCRLVAWKNICRAKEQGGWGILDLSTFNLSLLGKWRWKMMGCVSVQVKSGFESLFWKDRWLNGLVPMNIWPDEFLASTIPHRTVRELVLLLEKPSFVNEPDVVQILSSLNVASMGDNDKKVWGLTSNGVFSVKSFYGSLNDGGLRCPIANTFWKGPCPKKVNIFNWLAWKNKILSLENLAKRRCNRLPNDMCVLCHADVESTDHLFLKCHFSREVWAYLCRFLQFPELPQSMDQLWSVWRSALRPAARVFGDLFVKAYVWSIWLSRNDCIFANKCHSPLDVVMKSTQLLLSWYSAAPEGVREKIGDLISSIRRSLEFVGPRTVGMEGTPLLEVDQSGGEE